MPAAASSSDQALAALAALDLDDDLTAAVDDRGWRQWAAEYLPHLHSFAPHHELLWDWLWSIKPGPTSRPHVGIFSRGGGKSSTAEAAIAALGARGKRRYALYIRETQDKADDSVGNVGDLLSRPAFAAAYPGSSRPAVTKFGASRGWRRNRFRTADGWTVDALGLDVPARSIKLEQQRPDLAVFDDIDNRLDSLAAVEKKLRTITHTILPALSADAAVLVIQNIIHPGGVVAKLADGSADFLVDRILNGPVPAVRGLTTEEDTDPESGFRYQRITGGVATWPGQDLAACQTFIKRFGWLAFLEECQHQFGDREGALWNQAQLDRDRGARHNFGGGDVRWARYDPAAGLWLPIPSMQRVVVGVDPPGSSQKTGAEAGIVVVGLGEDQHLYVLQDASLTGLPDAWGGQAVQCFQSWRADLIAAEVNFGGEMVEAVIRSILPTAPYKAVRAARGKVIRAEPVAALSGRGQIHHLGRFPELEYQLCHWVPGEKSPDRLDAYVWAITELASSIGAWEVVS